MHHTKEKGDLGNIKIMADLSSQGFKILTPLSEHLPFDFVVYHQEKNSLLKIQSKYASIRGGVLSVNLCTSYVKKSGNVTNRYEQGSFDVLAVYCPDIDVCIYILENDLKSLKRSVNFNLTDKAGKRYFNDYTNLDKLLSVVL